MASGIVLVRRIKERNRTFRGARIAVLACNVSQAAKGPCRDGIPRWRRMILARLWPVKELLVTLAGEKKAARFAILEFFEQRVGELDGELEVTPREPGLHQLEQRRDKERVVVEIGVEMRAPVLISGEELAVVPHAAADDFERAARRSDPFRAVTHAPSVRRAAIGVR